ncbi:MAG: ABC transporter permease [Nitrospinota bacterium]
MWLETALIVTFLAAVIRMAAPLILAALGEVFSESSGVLNLAVEGLMMMGAFMAYLAADQTKSAWLGLAAAVGAGILLGLVLGVLYVSLRLDQIVAGLAANIAFIGLSAFLFRLIYGRLPFTLKVRGFAAAPIPYLGSIPLLGEVLFHQNVMVYGALLLVPVAGFLLYKTQFGLKVRAAGENPEAPDNVGVSVPGVRYVCIVFGGVMACVGGAFLTLGHINLFVEGMTAGRGWIAIACVVFGRWSPYRALAGALLFGAADALQLRFQAAGVALPFQILSMLPYVLTIVALMGVSRRAQLPAALCVPYVRGER